jgi:hypothetical protein
LSDDPSTRDRRITRAHFRDCLSSTTCSKAGLCSCTRHAVSNCAEPTFALLRYFLGGDRPSQTAQLARFLGRIHGSRLGHKNIQGGISPAPPPRPEPGLRRLPPILRRTYSWPIPAYSKGPRGLSVLLRVHGIFTASSISPSRSWRQCSSDYAIHARRNLPDKELRYLRTVIVTAAIDRCFGRKLWPCGLTCFLNIPASSKRQTVYILLRVSTVLCF